MIDFEDEILEGEPRYRVRDADGNLIHDNVSIEMTTDVIQEGTPLNKALFDAIKNDLTEYKNNLNFRFKLSNEYSEWKQTQEEIERTYVSSRSDWTVIDPIGHDNTLVNNVNGFEFYASAYTDDSLANAIDGDDNSYADTSGLIRISHASKFKVKKINAVFQSKYSGSQTQYFSTDDSAETLDNRVPIATSNYYSLPNNGSQNMYYIINQYGSLDNYQMTRVLFREFINMTYAMETNVYTFEGINTLAEGTIIKIRIPTNANNDLPTTLRIADVEQDMGWKLKAGGLYEFVYLDGELKNITVME